MFREQEVIEFRRKLWGKTELEGVEGDVEKKKRP